MYSFLTFRNASERAIEYLLAGAVLVTVIALWWVFSLLADNRKLSEDTTNSISHTRNVLLISKRIETDVLAIESAARGYLITVNDSALIMMHEAAAGAREGIDSLMRLVANDHRQRSTVRTLDRLLEARIRFAQRQVSATLSGAYPAGQRLTASGDGIRLTASIRTLFDNIRSRQETLLASRTELNRESMKRATFLTRLLGSMIACVVLASVVLSARALRKRMAAEKSAMATSLYLRSVLDNISDGVIVTGRDLNPQLCNPAAERIVGSNAQLLRGNEGSSGIFLSGTRQHAHLGELLVDPAVNGAPVDDLELTVVNASTGERTLTATSRPLTRSDGTTAVIVLHDSTEIKRSQERLLKANAELDAFSYSISHDLRAPLRAVSGFSQILLEDYGKKLDDEAVRLCTVIIRNAEKMGRLIDDLLRFSRVGRHTLQPELIDMEALFRNIVEKTVREGGMEKTKTIVRPMPPAYADYDLLNQVLVNLVSNAVKYSSRSDNPVVEAGADTTSGETVYYVKDNGDGFDMQYYHKLFEVFQRLHHQHEFEGTGVGLSIVKRIIERHNGKIWAESAPGKGATFYFTLNHEPATNNDSSNG